MLLFAHCGFDAGDFLWPESIPTTLYNRPKRASIAICSLSEKKHLYTAISNLYLLKLVHQSCVPLEVMYLTVLNLSYFRGSAKGYHSLFNYNF